MESVGGGPRVPQEPIAARLCPGGRCISFRPAPPRHCLFSACLAPARPCSARGALSPPGSLSEQPSSLGGSEDPFPLGMAQPGISVKSLVSSYETRVVGVAPGPPRKKGCVSSPCSPRGASPIRGASGPSPHRGLGGPGQRPSPCRGMDKTLLSLILYCHRYRQGMGGRLLCTRLGEEARAFSEKLLESSWLGCPDTWLGICSSSSPVISLCLSSGSGSLVGIDNKIEKAMVREAILVPGGPGSCADAEAPVSFSCPAAPSLLSSLGSTNSQLPYPPG